MRATSSTSCMMCGLSTELPTTKDKTYPLFNASDERRSSSQPALPMQKTPSETPESQISHPHIQDSAPEKNTK